MHDVYGVDCDSGILTDRSWRWLKARIQGLLTADTRLHRHFRPDDGDEQQHDQ
jgi:hypothetical protein